jgi:predicted Rdx family selenoprotein
VAKITAPMVAERNDNARDGGSPERDFGHSERKRASNNPAELD